MTSSSSSARVSSAEESEPEEGEVTQSETEDARATTDMETDQDRWAGGQGWERFLLHGKVKG